MKFAAAISFLFPLLSLTTATSISNGNLRAPRVEESSCNSFLDEQSCTKAADGATGLPCEWCVAGAIPSECMSQDQAKDLPAGVFDCKVPGAAASFNFVQGKRFVLNAKDHGNSDICDPSSKSISGYMDIKGSEYDENGENKHLFFWMFEKRGDIDPTTTPFVIWLTGGPGCSSTLALLVENGPCSVNTDGASTTVNPYSWTEVAHVLWLDQPAGVGFSYGQETDTNEKMVSEDVYYFLQAFFQTYTEYADNPLYIVGESYAGHYVPAITHRVWMGNKELKPNTVKLPLAGFGIGNGLTSPEVQYQYYPEMVFNNSHGIKVVDESTYEAMKAVVPKCTGLIHKCNQGDSVVDTFACQTAFIVCNTGLTSPYQMTGLNPYDIRKKCEIPPLCYDFSHVAKWLNNKDVKKALNVDEKHSHAWESCNFGINMQFHTDWMKDFSGYVSDLLNDGIPALIYAGDVDFICNYLGNRAWTYELEWKGKAAFQSAEEHEWNGSGLARSAQGLTFLQVYDAGHMVPSDQPKVSLDMLGNFFAGGAF